MTITFVLLHGSTLGCLSQSLTSAVWSEESLTANQQPFGVHGPETTSGNTVACLTSLGVGTRIYCTDTKHVAACPEKHRAGPQWRLPAYGAA